MRRKDREIAEPGRVDSIIEACDCIRLGLADGAGVYIVPMNFAYVRAEGRSIFYLHCAKQGKKLDLHAQNPRVGFELDTNHAVNPGETGCDYSFRYQSVIGNAIAAVVHDVEEKKDALRRIVYHYSGKEQWTFSDEQAASVTVIRLDVTDMACKEHL